MATLENFRPGPALDFSSITNALQTGRANEIARERLRIDAEIRRGTLSVAEGNLKLKQLEAAQSGQQTQQLGDLAGELTNIFGGGGAPQAGVVPEPGVAPVAGGGPQDDLDSLIRQQLEGGPTTPLDTVSPGVPQLTAPQGAPARTQPQRRPARVLSPADIAKATKIFTRMERIKPGSSEGFMDVLKFGNEQQLEIADRERKKQRKRAFLLKDQPFEQQQRRLTIMREEDLANNLDVSGIDEMLQMDPDRLAIEITGDLVLDKDIDEALKIAAAAETKPIEEQVIDVPGGLKQRRRLNPATRLFENIGAPFDPSVKSPAKIAEEKEAIKFKGTEDFLNASLLEEKKLAIKERSKTAVLKRKKLESEIREIGIDRKKEEFRRQSKIVKADLVLGKIAEAKKFIEENWFVTGFMGGMLQAVGGTDARNLRGMIDTIKANIGFAELQAMRDASPTGGALGQVAVQEINFLQSTIAALDQAQDDDILLQNLEQVADSMRRIKKIQLDAVGADTGITLETGPAVQKKVRVKF